MTQKGIVFLSLDKENHTRISQVFIFPRIKLFFFHFLERNIHGKNVQLLTFKPQTLFKYVLGQRLNDARMKGKYTFKLLNTLT